MTEPADRVITAPPGRVDTTPPGWDTTDVVCHITSIEVVMGGKLMVVGVANGRGGRM